jgi:hypothetical protein
MKNNKLIDNIKAEVFEHTDTGGFKYYVERLENTVRVSEIDCDEYKVGCKACKKYGMNLACPPLSRSNFIPHPGARFIPHFFCVKF